MKKKKVVAISMIVVFIVVSILCIIRIKYMENQSANLDSEILRSQNYAQITDEDSKIDGTEYVKFSSFFTRDLNNDGNAEKLLGTCRNVNSTDVLYMDLNVLTNGYLKNGKITINGTNFNYSMNMVKDRVLKNNYISDNVKVIELKDVYAGTQKLIIGDVVANIGNDINNYSKVSSVTLTGTHVSDEGLETQICKTIDLTVDWHGTTKAELYTRYQATTFYYNYDQLDTETVSFNFRLDELQKELILKENVATVTIPELNGYSPTEVKCANDNIESEYNSETRVFTIKRSSICNEEGNITSTLSRSNTYTVDVTYPKEAYNQISSYTTLTIPIEGYYIGYNNSNKEFVNPYKSNIVNGNITLVFRETPKGEIYNFYVDFVDKKYVSTPNYRYVISKQDILNLYDNYDEESTEKIKNKEYVVRWLATRGSEGVVPSMTMSETKEEGTTTQAESTYGDKWNSTIMEQYVTNTGIYFENADKFLEEDGTIYVYNNDTNELIKTFTKEEWNKYTRQNPYKYETPIKHIRVETSKTNLDCSLSVYNVKELETEKVLENFTKEQVNDIELVYTYLTGICNIEGQASGIIKDIDYVYYVSEKSNSKITLKTKKLSTQETLNNQKIYIDTVYEQVGDAKWQNGEFLVEVPEEIINMQINNVAVNNPKVKIVAYDLFKENGKYFIKIITENEEPVTFKITINCNITPNPKIATTNKVFKLYSYNEYCNDYYYPVQDTHDVDSDNNIEEQVGIAYTNISLLSPTSIITLETLSNYNEENETTIAPNVAEVKRDTRQATVNIDLTNNYPNTVSGVQILGKIPFEGNTYILNGKDLGSKFTTYITDAGISVPEELKEKAVVYYSEKENPTKDLLDNENGWTLKENVQDFSKIKTFLIDLKEYTIEVGKGYTFKYVVNLPENIDYNLESYSDHAVYYELDTDGGKLALSTEPNKVGVRIVRKFDFNLTKYKKSTLHTVPGATYELTEKDENEVITNNRLLTTKTNGQCSVANLYVGKKYVLKEISAPSNYVKNEDVVEFTITEEASGEVKINIISEDTFSSEPIVNSQDNVLSVAVEDMPKYNLIINKTSLTGEKLENVRFELKENKRTYKTDENGQLSIEDLIPYKTYTIVEKKANGYYVDSTEKTFKLIYEGNNIKIESNDDNIKNATIKNDENSDLPIVETNVINEKIPTYNLQILKVAENDENNIGLEGATIQLYSEDTKETKKMKTDSTGKIEFNDLYRYVDGKYITGKYTIKELEGPLGYATNLEEITFVVKIENEELNISIENKDNLTVLKETEVEGDTIKIILQDKPLFKLTKVDEKTNEPLDNTKFIIYRTNSEYNQIIDFAKDVNGNYVGEKNSENKYVITTDKNGEAIIPLEGGYYKAIEIEAPEEYNLPESESERTRYFKIEGYQEKSELMINSIEDLVDFSNSVALGNTYEGHTVGMSRNLDFEDDNSYDDPNDTSYGDYNGDGTIEGIKAELINKSGKGFKPIGNSSTQFKGTFNGNSYEIKNIYIKSSNDYVGLFGVTSFAKVMNVSLSGGFIQGYTSYYRYYCVGGIIGFACDSEVSNSYNSAEITVNGHIGKIGGIIGTASKCKITNCYNLGNLHADNIQAIGGIVADTTKDIDISYCYNKGNIESNITTARSEFGDIGGIVGNIQISNNETSVRIKNCFNNSDISVKETIQQSGLNIRIGGIIGTFIKSAGEMNFSNCYNEGTIDAETNYTQKYIGGIVGSFESSSTNNEKDTISDCYNISEISFSGESYEEIGGITGKNSGGNILNCHNYGKISGYKNGNTIPTYIGGISGGGTNVTIYQCHNEGEITSERKYSGENYVGGILGSGSGNVRISNCYNVADISNGNFDNSATTGGIIGIWWGSNQPSSYYLEVTKCYNEGKIDSIASYDNHVGGILGEVNQTASGGLIKECYNTGIINATMIGGTYSNHNGNAVGGITGRLFPGLIMNCYNEGNLNSFVDISCNYSWVGGISAEGIEKTEIINCYNKGTLTNNIGDSIRIIDHKTGGICANMVSALKLVNTYNIGSVEANNTRGEIGGTPAGTYKYNYYLDGDGKVGTGYGGMNQVNVIESKTEEYMKSKEFTNLLNNNKLYVSSEYTLLDWQRSETGYPVFNLKFKLDDIRNTINIEDNIVNKSVTELTIINEKKQYEVTTEIGINSENARIGGTITGEYTNGYTEANNIKYVETIEYNLNSQKEIIIAPNEGYIIKEIVINEESVDFLANEDGSYIIPEGYFKEAKENYHILVIFEKTSETLILNKVDSADNTKLLPGAKFKIEQIEDRPQVTNEVGDLTGNSATYTEQNLVTGVLGSLTNNGRYYFTISNGTYIPNNSGVNNSIAKSYIPIDLTGKSGSYTVTVNANVSSERNCDIGYATITQSTTAPAYNSTTGRFMYISGTVSSSGYSYTIQGGSKYYLHLGYRKNGSANTGNDKVTINSVNVYQNSYFTYNFTQSNGKYISSNQGKNNTVSNSYIPIDLTNTKGKYTLTVNAEVSSESGWDIGYATVTKDTSRPAYDSTTGRFIYISGTQPASEYTTVLEAGYKYYLHLGYRKDGSSYSGSDTFTVNSVKLSLNTDDFYTGELTTNSNGQIIENVPLGKYRITELEAPEGYALDTTSKEVNLSAGDCNITIENSKTKRYEITKVDEETNKPISGAKFAIYKLKETYEVEDFIKDRLGNYIGNKNSDEIYEISTDANGQIVLNLVPGLYKAVEIKSADGYVLEESESARTTFFEIEESKDNSNTDESNTQTDSININDADVVINNIEDLVRLSNEVNSGITYEGKTIKLAKTLDFNEDSSYNNPTDTSFEDYNGNGNSTEGIKQELTTGAGFKSIGFNQDKPFKGIFNGNGYEIKNINISNNDSKALFGYIKSGKVLNLGLEGEIKIYRW